MTAKEYLGSIFLVKAYIDKKRSKYEDVKAKAYGIKTQRLDDMKVQSGGKKKDFTDYVDDIADLEAEFINDYCAYHVILNKMTNEIFDLDGEGHLESLLSVYKRNIDKGYRPKNSKRFKAALEEFEQVHAEMLAEEKNLLTLYHEERSKLYNPENSENLKVI